MRSKKKAKKAARQSSWRPALKKLGSFMAVALPVVIVAVILFLSAAAVRSAFPVRKVVFSGSAHLSDEELRGIAGIRGGENLLSLSARSVARKMLESPWIRDASVRKEFPDTLHILIKEAEPFALLDLKGRMFIVDDGGKMLEELRDTPIPFLPVISGNPFNEKAGYAEAVHLAAAIKRDSHLAGTNHVEIIAHKPQELAVNIDGTVVKIGAGEYDEKLGRLAELGEEIKARRIPVDYIDLRFANRVIVKPVNEVIR